MVHKDVMVASIVEKKYITSLCSRCTHYLNFKNITLVYIILLILSFTLEFIQDFSYDDEVI